MKIDGFIVALTIIGGVFLGFYAVWNNVRADGMPPLGSLVLGFVAMIIGGLAEVGCHNSWASWEQILGYCGMITAMSLIALSTLPAWKRILGQRKERTHESG
jgi:hypothetical protein